MSKRFKVTRNGYAFVVGLLLFVTLASGLPYAIGSRDARRPAIDSQITTLQLPATTSLASLQRAKVDKVIDGDTIDVTIDGKQARIRYYGVDTPERGDKCYREATDRNLLLVEGKEVLLLPDARNEDPGGRLLRYVFLADGTSLDATLVAEGFANAWRQDGRYRADIIDLESQAKTSARGCLWKATS